MREQHTGGNGLNGKTAGVAYGAAAFLIWGILPLYWKLLQQVPSYEIIFHRIFWCFVFTGTAIILTGRLNTVLQAAKNKRSLILIILCAVLVSINWFVYIWAVNSSHLVEASMGYYINPLVSVLLGVFILKEKLSSVEYAAFFLAAAGVLMLALHYGRIPWIALALAFSFAFYGLLKKMVPVDSTTGLALETAVLAPAALIFILFRQATGSGALGTISPLVTALLICAGAVTAVPLLLFAKSAKRIELSTVGFLQYLTPTLGLLLGVVVFKEEFTRRHLLSFSFIWAALLLFSLSRAGLFKKGPAIPENSALNPGGDDAGR